jgi:hypothetical protein
MRLNELADTRMEEFVAMAAESGIALEELLAIDEMVVKLRADGDVIFGTGVNDTFVAVS